MGIEVKVGDRVSYGDAINPRGYGTIAAVPDPEHGWKNFVIEWDDKADPDGNMPSHTPDLTLPGWRLETASEPTCPACGERIVLNTRGLWAHASEVSA